MLKYADLDQQHVMGELNNMITSLGQTFVTVNNAAGVTWTAAQMISTYMLRSGATAVSDTTPTAAQIVAALPQTGVNDTFLFTVINTNSGTLTVVAGTGVTLAGTTTIPTVNTREYIGIITNATAGSEAVTLRGVQVAAN